MTRSTATPVCWYLTGSQALYGQDTLDQVATQSRGIAEQLDGGGELPAPVVWKPVLTDAEAIRRIMLAANADDDCAGLIIWMHTFSPAKMWIGGLSELRNRCCTYIPKPMSICRGRGSTWIS